MKKARKLISVLLAALMIAMVFVPTVFAASYEQKVPHIDFRGFMSYTIYEDKDNPDSKRIFPPTTESIIATAVTAVPVLGKLAITGDWKEFGDFIIPILNTMLSPIGFGGDGTPLNNSGVHFTYPTKEELEANNLEIDFQYDWRADPYESAAQLNNLINYLTDELGYSQVTLESHSYAGIVMLTYLSVYGTEKIKSCCFNATAVYGAQFAGELVKGKVAISDEALVEFLKGLLSQNEYEDLIAALADVLSMAGITGFVADFVTDLFENLSDRIWTEVVLPALGNWPSIWAMVPDADFEEGYANVFDNLYADSKIDLTGLKNRIARFSGDIRANREDKLIAINESDTQLYVIARYGYSGVPLGDIWTANTDTVLNTTAESFGATCKDYDYSLDNINTNVSTQRYIAPNEAVDASTCLFPDQTWFIRNCKHTQRDEAIVEFAKNLLYSDEQATIDTYTEYPQYLLFNAVTSDVVIDKNETPVRDSFWATLFNWLRQLFSWLSNKLKK